MVDTRENGKQLNKQLGMGEKLMQKQVKKAIMTCTMLDIMGLLPFPILLIFLSHTSNLNYVVISLNSIL